MFTLAHLSDVHLSPMPPLSLRALATKRFYGYQSWLRRRRQIHRRHVTDLLVEDVRRAAPDHVAITGDLVNLATRQEFANAAQWLSEFGAPDWVTVVPGNHDAYVPVPFEDGIGRWADYMRGDLAVAGTITRPSPEPFPFVRTRRNIALIGLSSSVPTGPLLASGRLGHAQIEMLGEILSVLRARGFFRVVLIHHPPLPGMNARRKALLDAPRLAGVLAEEGAELVLHGHNHQHSLKRLVSRHGPVHVVGVPSASAVARHGKPASAWYRYAINRTNGMWTCDVTVRAYDEASDRFTEANRLTLDMDADDRAGQTAGLAAEA